MIRVLSGDCRAVLIELNPQYVEMQRNRITGDAPLFAQVQKGHP